MKSTLGTLVLAGLLLTLVLVQAAGFYMDYRTRHRPLLSTAFQSVTLSNGEVYYGRLHHFGTDHPVLRMAFRVDPGSDGTPQLRWLRDEREGADHLIFPRDAIVHVRPVRSESALGRVLARHTPAQ